MEKEKIINSEDILLQKFPDLWKYIEPDNVTDVDFNSGNLWISTTDTITQKVVDEKITEEYMRNVANSIAVHTGKTFNAMVTRMFVASDILRVSCVHPKVSGKHISVCLRKELADIRFTEEEAIANGMCDQATYNLIRNAILANKSITVCGLPHAGKTELVKKFSGYIPEYEKVITIEDVAELHYSKIYPNHNCIELSIGEGGVRECLNDALRMNPARILFSEVIGVNTAHLLECWSNGVPTIATTHTDDTRDIGDKLVNSADLKEDSERVTNQVYKNLGVAILMRKKIVKDNKILRYIDQVTFYYRKKGENGMAMVVKNGVLRPKKMPDFIREEIEREIGRDIYSAPELGGISDGE